MERLYKRRFPVDRAFSHEQAKELALLSRCANRQLGLLIDRRGKVDTVIVGSSNGLVIPQLSPYTGRGSRGLRLLHTHLDPAPLDQEDLTDMLFLRLDAIVALTVTEAGEPEKWQWARLADSPSSDPYVVSQLMPWHENALDIATMPGDDSGPLSPAPRDNSAGRALLVSVSQEPQPTRERNLAELAALAKTAGLRVAGSLSQRAAPHPAHILGKGKLAELEIRALNANADILIFDGELTPAQLNNLAEITSRKVLDRSQLILDIFASRAATKAGKLQVELAQLSYNQSRLAGKNKALDRLMGGVGGRGPGETKLETDRRKIRERVTYLKREIEKLRKRRAATRHARERNGLPCCALAGYTNAGKSTLLNILTSSSLYTADQHFATLDPTTRRLKFPQEKEIVVSDTVGFIRNLPKELLEAFRATLEELDKADILLHVADASSKDIYAQIDAVNATLEELRLNSKRTLLVLNKIDLVSAERLAILKEDFPEAVFISAKNGDSLNELLTRLEKEIIASRWIVPDETEDSFSDPQ
ncbi:MAG: GTPase HflX [Desulfovibrio sp.]|nr:GTPase HflX [Desulfovibrio sp.]